MSEALERLSKIVDEEEFIKWYESLHYDKLVADIKEVVALAKESKQPSIDAMRFEAAKAAMSATIAHSGRFNTIDISTAILIADALIAELQKTKP